MVALCLLEGMCEYVCGPGDEHSCTCCADIIPRTTSIALLNVTKVASAGLELTCIPDEPELPVSLATATMPGFLAMEVGEEVKMY